MSTTPKDLSVAGTLLNALSEHSNDLVFAKNCDGELVFANPATLQALGKTCEEVLRQTCSALLSYPGEADQINADDSWVMQQSKPLTVERTLHMAHGVQTYSVKKSPWLDDSGKLLGVAAIYTDISASKPALEATFAERTASLRELSNHIETLREKERQSIARTLHDDMGAMLTSLSIHLQSAYVLFPDDEKWSPRKAKIQSLLNEIVASTRAMQTRLRPAMLELFGLKTAVSEVVTEFAEQTGLSCKTSLPDEDLPAHPNIDIAVYRMLQEILDNVVRHAQATEVAVILDADDDQLTLTVRDNGVGMNQGVSDSGKNFGLRALRERAAFLGGNLTTNGGTGGGGTTVSIQIPLDTTG